MAKAFRWQKRGHQTANLAYLLLGGLLFRSICAYLLSPGFDEAYYYLYSRHLHWSYFDHPLLVAFSTRLGWQLTGLISPFTIRIGALLLYTGSLGWLYLTAKRLFDQQVGLLAVAIATVTPLFTVGFGLLTSPENPLIFFWTATLYLATLEFFPNQGDRAAVYRPSWRIAGLGVLLGLTCLGKYHGFVLGLGLVGFCLSQAAYRKALTSPWTLAALVLFVATLFPLWFWNLQHDWISFQFQLSMRFETSEASGYSLLSLLGVLLMELGYLFPTIGWPLWGVAGRSLWQQRQRFSPKPSVEIWQLDKKALILWVSLPIMLGFTLLGGAQPILPGWPAPGFWGITILLAEEASHWRGHTLRRWLVGTGLSGASLLLLVSLHVNLGIFQQPSQYALLGGFVPPPQDPTTALIDPRSLHQAFAASPELTAALKNTDFVFTNDLFLAGYIDMAIRPLTSVPVTVFSPDPRGFAFWYDPAQWLGKTALYLTSDQFYQQPEILAAYRPYFAGIEETATIALRRGGTVTKTFHAFTAKTMIRPYVYPY
ncbi:ArnT family glycosyltransferase [Almyronema epifaneia]|uniref:ArnT family glycosyltransferase n=1 Tax=Almyronema epifaneia S1 TaxID=2991925 RepID=A0ABW6IE40_9CYAN